MMKLISEHEAEVTFQGEEEEEGDEDDCCIEMNNTSGEAKGWYPLV
jgi:hypothetical protein